MKKFFSKIIAGLVLSVSFTGSVFANSEFCNGFEMGYKMVRGNMSFVPFCPLEPLTPLGSTPFQEGIKAGMMRAMGGR